MDISELRHVAALAELSLSDAQAEALASDIGRIVAFVAELESVDTEGVAETAHPLGVVPTHSELGWRADVPVPGLSHDEALAGAPQTEHGGFAVPPVIETP